MSSATDRVLELADRVDPGGVVGIYLYGSATTGGLRPDSDLDILLITQRSLVFQERQQVTDLLLQYSGRPAVAESGRPIELTSVVLSSVVPWSYPPQCDYQYGEWLRDDFGNSLEPHVDPDLTMLLATAYGTGKPLRGPRLDDVIAPVPQADIHRAIHDCLPALLADLVGDERNVLLTLARMIVTLQSDEIVSKDEAAQRVSAQVPAPHAALLDLARQAYLGHVSDDWTAIGERTDATAQLLAAMIRDL